MVEDLSEEEPGEGEGRRRGEARRGEERWSLANEIWLILKAEEAAVARLRRAREEVERKARRGEIDPMHEHAIQNIGQLREGVI